MAEIPETSYAKTAVGRIAYQIVGDGPIDVLINLPSQFPIDLMWDEPRLVRFLNGLSAFSRHIWFDGRGRGASDPMPPDDERLQESQADDILALLDTLSIERAVVVGFQAGGGPAALFAASHPGRTTALVLVNIPIHIVQPNELPHDVPAWSLDQMVKRVQNNWGTVGGADLIAPGLANDALFRSWSARAQRLTCTPDLAVQRNRSGWTADVRKVLDSVNVPTLVISRPAGRLIGPDVGPYLAAHIRDSKYIELPGEDILFFVGDVTPMLDAIEEFLTGKLPAHSSDRVLASVLFTDIVGSTDHLARVGDRTWKATLTAHDALVTREIERHRGRQIKTTGDGVLATFDGPGRAVRCAQAIVEAVRSLGIEVRAGVHTGEIELRGDDVGGIGVHIAARVSSLAGAGEVLVSRTVTDLVAGSGIEFEDRGEQDLKGVPGSWRVYSVTV